MDRPQTSTPAPAPAAAPRGAFAAVAALAAVLLSIAAIAASPRTCLGAFSGPRIAILDDTADHAVESASHPTPSGAASASPDRSGAPRARAALAARSAVMLRHTSLPPPAGA